MTDKELAEAWERILEDRAVRGDGERAKLWLRRKLMEVVPFGADTCAVHEHNGSRRLAATILGFATRPDDESTERRETHADLELERSRRAQQGAVAPRRRVGS